MRVIWAVRAAGVGGNAYKIQSENLKGIYIYWGLSIGERYVFK
jgi:hypothetical protein